MQNGKSSFYGIEAYHNRGKLIIRFMPQFLKLVESKISSAGLVGSKVVEVDCYKWFSECGVYIKVIMQEIEVDYSDAACNWFFNETWQ